MPEINGSSIPVCEANVNHGRRVKAILREHAREAKIRRRELEKRLKEEAKLTALEQARLEVEDHENRIELLLSIHKEQSVACEWLSLLSALPPPEPKEHAHYLSKAKQQIRILPPHEKHKADSIMAEAMRRDQDEYREALNAYSHEVTEWQKLKVLASRVLAGEATAYKDALFEFNPFAEIAELGTKLGFKVHDKRTLICYLKVKGIEAIPTESKALTSTGKVSVKPMPKVRYQELYQDYICACVLRVAREVIALLPIDTLLITASADVTDPTTGHAAEQAVLSVAITRLVIGALDFERLDPSEAMANFIHRGDFNASRKTGAFKSIVPLTPTDLPHHAGRNIDSKQLTAQVRALCDELKSENHKFAEAHQIMDDED